MSPFDPPKDHTVHADYEKFLSLLCSTISTDNVECHTQAGLPRAICKAQNLTLERVHDIDHDLDIYACALVIYLWQILCLQIQCD